jgi:hypothetical protein
MRGLSAHGATDELVQLADAIVRSAATSKPRSSRAACVVDGASGSAVSFTRRRFRRPLARQSFVLTSPALV